MRRGIWRDLAVAGLLAAVLAGGPATLAQAPAGPEPTSQAPAAPAQKPSTPQQQKPQDSGVTISVEVPVVTLDVVAATQNGDIITGLKKENFRVLEDGQPQQITNFAPTDAPITMVILLEFSNVTGGWFSGEAKYWAGALFPNLNQKDWVALVTFDMRPRMEVDFTQNKEEVEAAIMHLYYPGFSESNLFDAILDTTDRLKDVKGKKSILIMASGIDTFSKHTLDQTMKLLRNTDTTLFAVGVDRPISNYLEMHHMVGGRGQLTFLQAENQLKTFTQMTGGMAWFPQFDGELPGIMQKVAEFLRHQYSLSYTPSNQSQDGKYRKIKVELVAPDGGPFQVVDQRGKKQKYVVYAREGYQPVKGGVGD
jgi:VWFA-related protein